MIEFLALLGAKFERNLRNEPTEVVQHVARLVQEGVRAWPHPEGGINLKVDKP